MRTILRRNIYSVTYWYEDKPCIHTSAMKKTTAQKYQLIQLAISKQSPPPNLVEPYNPRFFSFHVHLRNTCRSLAQKMRVKYFKYFRIAI